MPAEYTLDTTILDQIIDNLPEEIDALLRSASEGITDDIKLSFNTSPPGRVYTRGGISHVASVPDYPPNVDTGALRASMHWYQDGPNRYIVADGVAYGYWLEDGTDTIEPRPFVQPVFKTWQNSKFVQLAIGMGLATK